MENKKMFEVNDDALDTVAGGAIDLNTILDQARPVTAKATCSLCGTNKGALGTMFGQTGIICCGQLHLDRYAQGDIGMDAILVLNPSETDYTEGWDCDRAMLF